MGKRICLIAALCLTTLVATAAEKEPKYHGRSLSKWLQLQSTGSIAEQKEAETAVSAIGTNALPCLIEWLTEITGEYLHAPNAFAILGEVAAPSVPALEHLMLGTNELSAILAAQCLGQIGKPALPPLLAALTNKNYRISTHAALCIVDLETNARPAVPIFLKQLEDLNPKVRARAADALGTLQLEPQLVVPALTNALADVSPTVSYLALQSLAEFGPDARSAAPVIAQFLTHPHLREQATNALLKIAPEALTNAPSK